MSDDSEESFSKRASRRKWRKIWEDFSLVALAIVTILSLLVLGFTWMFF